MESTRGDGQTHIRHKNLVLGNESPCVLRGPARKYVRQGCTYVGFAVRGASSLVASLLKGG